MLVISPFWVYDKECDFIICHIAQEREEAYEHCSNCTAVSQYRLFCGSEHPCQRRSVYAVKMRAKSPMLQRHRTFFIVFPHQKQFFSHNGGSGNSHTTEAFPPIYQFKDPTKRADMTDAVYKNLNRSIDALKDSGVTVYLNFAPFCTEACMDTVTKEALDSYSKTLASKLHVVCISTQSKHDYAAKYFFEMFHMTQEGKTIRTKRLAEELNEQFKKEA